jgi:endogenous inhibitor of DNA gyrase (YacG/DUF329 family)
MTNKNCPNCGKEIVESPNGRKKKFCNDNCRATFFQNSRKTSVKVPVQEWNDLQEQLKALKNAPKIAEVAQISIKEETSTLSHSEIIKGYIQGKINQHEAELSSLPEKGSSLLMKNRESLTSTIEKLKQELLTLS